VYRALAEPVQVQPAESSESAARPGHAALLPTTQRTPDDGVPRMCATARSRAAADRVRLGSGDSGS